MQKSPKFYQKSTKFYTSPIQKLPKPPPPIQKLPKLYSILKSITSYPLTKLNFTCLCETLLYDFLYFRALIPHSCIFTYQKVPFFRTPIPLFCIFVTPHIGVQGVHRIFPLSLGGYRFFLRSLGGIGNFWDVSRNALLSKYLTPLLLIIEG